MSKPLQHQIIARARQIITDPAHWTQCELAQFKNNRSAKPWHQRAQRFCAVGALMRAASELSPDRFTAEDLANDALIAVLSFAEIPASETLHSINDAHDGHVNVLKLFDAFLAGRSLKNAAWLHNLFPLDEDASLELDTDGVLQTSASLVRV
jgi:hypothetical protein